MYNQMTPYKLERNTFKGKALYSYADKQKGVAYIGGDKAYQRDKQLAAQQYLGFGLIGAFAAPGLVAGYS